MSRKKQQQNETMTPMQHRAVLVCILCVLAVLLTFGITTTLLKKGGEEPAPSVSESVADPTSGGDLSGHYQIDNASTALLTETADAGDLSDFVALVGEALLRSLALYLKAARHEGLEEPGAFEQQVLRLREQLASYDA